MKFGKNYWRCEIFDNQKRRIISILNRRREVTTYKIVITSNSLDIYIEDMIRGKEKEFLDELKNILDIFKSVVKKNGLKESKLEKVVLSKGYEIACSEYEKRFCGKPINIVEDNIGISLRYVKRDNIPLVIYSYLVNMTDINNFMEESSKYIDILIDANI